MIPKIIHISWKNEDIFEGKSFLIKHGLLNLIKLNPDWKVEFSNDSKVENYLKENISAFDYDLIKNKTIIEKLDLWRLLKLFLEGGLYIDLDRFYNIPLSQILDDTIDCVLPTYLDHDFSHDIMLSKPGNPIFATAANLNIQRRKMGYSQIYLLGPQTYMNAVSTVLCGQSLESSPGIEIMNKLREIISNTSFAKTFREVPWKETLVFKTTPEFDHIDYELEKKNMYQEFDMHHWTHTF